jgi:hypothetical protein
MDPERTSPPAPLLGKERGAGEEGSWRRGELEGSWRSGALEKQGIRALK